ncbi:MAG: cation transporter [candidate division WOR-3 bacterium]|nr:MAG: cation transporter [candidate division WOR-3 bacterium]
MEVMIDRFIRLFHLDEGDRFRNYGYFEGFFSVVVNFALFAFKFVFGVALNSVSLIAESFHSLSDVVTSAIIIFGFRISAKPADAEHPFGHGRVERILSIVIACLLIVVGAEFFKSGFIRFRNPIPIEADVFVIVMLIISILIKEFMYGLSLSLGRRIGSIALKADAWHHRTDSIATALVVLGFVAFRFGLYNLDGILGMIVSCIIAYTGIVIIKESGSALIGEAPSSTFVNKIKETAGQLDGIDDVHHIHVHDYGHQTEITIHVRLKGRINLDDAHEKASEVEDAIKRCVPGAEVTVHLEPYDESKKNS